MKAIQTQNAHWLISAFGLILLSGLVNSSVHAQSNSGKVTFTTGVDFSQAYFRRHFKQERNGLVVQPYADINFNVYSDDGVGLNGITFTLGQWNSIHTGPTGKNGSAENAAAWYESDIYGGFTLAIDNWEAEIMYRSLLSPNDSFPTVQELDLGLSMDDSSLLGAFSLQPYVLMVIETNGQTDGGKSEGVYLEFGVEPGIDLIDGVASVAFPLTLGLSLSNYYENGITTDTPFGFNDTFGHFDVGAVIAMPLGVPDVYGLWELTGEFHVMTLGSYLGLINDGDSVQSIGALGFSIGY